MSTSINPSRKQLIHVGSFLHVDPWHERGVTVQTQSPVESRPTIFSIDCQTGALGRLLVLPAQAKNKTGTGDLFHSTDNNTGHLGSSHVNELSRQKKYFLLTHAFENDEIMLPGE
jgi:hypothetical protein